jgi:hypothetical protein
VAVAGIGLVVVWVGAGVGGGRQEIANWELGNRQVQGVAEAVRAQADEDDTVLVWGNQPRLYRVAERRPASRFVYLFPLTTPGYATPQLIGEVLAELEANPPAVVVDAGSPGPGQPGVAPLLLDRPVGAEGRDLDLLDPLRDFVRARYELAEVVDGWPLYRLLDAGP